MYLKLKNNVVDKYPYTLDQLKSDNPNVSFPETIPNSTLSEYGVFPVSFADAPTVDYTKNVTEDTPKLINGQWTQVWEVTPASNEEIQERTDSQAAVVRDKRNFKLSECDWTQLPDSPVDKAAWAEYRQELRDVTNQGGFPWEVIWPTQP